MRNRELIRQWDILRELDAKVIGITIASLARRYHVHQRTIRRDLAALEHAGFPLATEKGEGTVRWKLTSKPFKRLTQSGLGLTEMCALYMSRSMLEALAGTPFREELTRALEKIQPTLPEGVRRFLDELPAVLNAKAEGRKRRDERRMRDIVPRILEASLQRLRCAMTYHSFSSRRVKNYEIEPYRLTYAQGGLYLIAFVAAYAQMRTFAVERIRALEVLQQHFDGKRKLPSKPFPHSLGVHTGEPQRIEIEFDRRVADFVREREWHQSQRVEDRPDGSILMTLDVSDDPPLRSWILSFGPLARVVRPGALAEEILEELEEARERYAPRMDFDASITRLYPPPGPRLPFSAQTTTDGRPPRRVPERRP
jgi:predicted DNA-binding transcriptional regulator YafY